MAPALVHPGLSMRVKSYQLDIDHNLNKLASAQRGYSIMVDFQNDRHQK